MKGLSLVTTNNAGIYKICVRNHTYIGQSTCLKSRLKSHEYELKRGSHGNQYMQNLFNKYGSVSFEVRILCELDSSKYSKVLLKKILTVLEQTYINIFHSDLNLQPAYITGFNSIREERVLKASFYHPVKGIVNTPNLNEFCNLHGLDKAQLRNVLKGEVVQYKGFFATQSAYDSYVLNLSKHSISNYEIPISSPEAANWIVETLFGLSNFYPHLNTPWCYEELLSDLFLLYIKEYFLDLLTACQSLTIDIDIDSYYYEYKTKPFLEGNLLCLYSNDTINPLKMANPTLFTNGYYGSTNNTYLGALTPGLRANNESLHNNVYVNAIEVQLDNPIVRILKDISLPVGTPQFYSPERGAEDLSLRQFLSRYESDLVPGFYVIYLSGLIESPQDILSSAYFTNTPSSLQGIVINNLLTTTNQIENAVLTSDLLELIRKVSDGKTYNNWLNLKVKLAIYYPARKELSKDVWIERMCLDGFAGYKILARHNPSNYWTRIPLTPFMESLEGLSILKNNKVTIGNSVLTCLTNSYYPLANTVIANNILGKVSKLTWMMSKGLGCKQIQQITGLYTPYLVPQLKKHLKQIRKPSIKSLCNSNLYHSEYLEFVSLIVEDSDIELLDRLTLEHLTEFWSYYNLKFDFPLLHSKDSIIHYAIALVSQDSNYMFINNQGEEVFRITRTTSQDETVNTLKSSFKQVLSYISNPKLKSSIPISISTEDRYRHCNTHLYKTYDEFYKATKAYKQRLVYNRE